MSRMRYAKFPLNCKAHEAANKAVYEKHEEIKPDEKLTMGSKHGNQRNTWMEAYKKSLQEQKIDLKTKISFDRQSKKVGQAVTDCPLKNSSSVATIVVQVFGYFRGRKKQTKKPLPDAKVKLDLGDDPLKTIATDQQGYAIFSPVDPGKHIIFAWKPMDTNKVLYRMDFVQTSVGDGDTKHFVIELEKDRPFNWFVTVVDCNKNPIPFAQVVAGSPPKPSTDGSIPKDDGPYPSAPGMSNARPRCDKQGEAILLNFVRGRYMVRAHVPRSVPIYRSKKSKSLEYVEYSDRKVVNCPNTRATICKTELVICPTPKKTMKIWIQSAGWSTKIVPVKVFDIPFMMWITTKLGILDGESGNYQFYRGTFTIGGLQWSKDLIKWFSEGYTTGPGHPKSFLVPRFINGALVNEKSFNGTPATLDLLKVEALTNSLINGYDLTLNDPKAFVEKLQTGPTNLSPPSVAEVKSGITIIGSNLVPDT